MAHILIVEDEEHIARMIEATLALGGYTCAWCADGAEAIDRVQRSRYDLVLLDVMLPGLDGFAVMERLQGQRVPVIFLSAMQQVEDKVRGLRLGAEDYIAKPFEAIELLARVEVVLRRQGRWDRWGRWGRWDPAWERRPARPASSLSGRSGSAQPSPADRERSHWRSARLPRLLRGR